MATVDPQRTAEDALVALYESRLAEARETQSAARRTVHDANVQLAAAQQATLSAQAALDALRSTLLVARAGRQSSRPTLPGDVLLEIFSLCYDPASTRPARNALALASVCKSWRQTAVNAARLWTTIKLDFANLTHAYRFLKMILERSGSLPLDVELREVPAVWYFDDPILEEAHILELCRRSRRMTFALDSSQTYQVFDNAPRFHSSFLPYFQSPMPHLEEFTFAPTTIGMAGNGVHIFTLAPKLRIVDMGTLDVDLLVPSKLPALESLKSRETAGHRELLAISTGWPQLKRLAVVVREQNIAMAPTEIVFEHLEELDALDGPDVLSALRPARVPKLHALTLPGSARQHFETFLSGGPFAPLTRLHVRAEPELPNAFVASFSLVPNLAHLTISALSDLELDKTFLLWAAFPQNVGERLLPSLRRLELVECNFSVSGTQMLAGFLQKRVDWGQRLHELAVVQTSKTITHPFPLWLRSRIEELVDGVTLDTDAVQMVEEPDNQYAVACF
ncbi:hypothetical protein EXIGLDRAFT_119956 [Exidia glandulosa HHB12029]|uniref:F-box domain-containing protein n=1 Tax=Exidia glandulosa HHB12029 TaxID=1314781 RepID=A0A165GFR1_EXIGL|nr:hypothetical protein EXIGLDRAFT_119956 [Exidia glandulosa HHB12029]